MKKMNKRGFMLTETLVVATFLVTTLLFLYFQLRTVTKSYDDSFKYNTVNGIYATNNVIKYIKTENIADLKTSLNNSNYIDITNCPSTYFLETEYCQVLFNSLKVEKAIFTKEDLRNYNMTGLNQTMLDFIDYIDYEGTNSYRIIIEFSDNTIASLKMN